MKLSKRITMSISFVAVFMGMGIAMPSCPGQQAMQQQIDSMQTKEADMNRKVMALDTQNKALTNDMTQVKTLLSQVSNTVLAQKQAIEQMDATIKQMAAARAAPPKAAPKGRPAKGGAKRR